MVKASKFLEPIVFAKRYLNNNLEPYQIALFSFKSTDATNIMTVNSILNGKAYIQEKVQGSNEKYYHCIFEDNPARTIYLASYSAVDKTDAVIKRATMYYCCRKYYHYVNVHTKAATLITPIFL